MTNDPGRRTEQAEQPAGASGEKWQKPLAEWRRIFRETPDYDCWPAPIRGWEIGALVAYIDALEAKLREAEADAEDLAFCLQAWMHGTREMMSDPRMLDAGEGALAAHNARKEAVDGTTAT